MLTSSRANVVYVSAILLTVSFCSSGRPAFSRSGAGQDTGTAASTGKPLSAYDQLRLEGNSALYNLDYKKAHECFEKMSQIAPEEPASYVYLANNLWLETLNRS
ncbi:MAG TPA: hypothetical protein VEZ90_05275, partial [Blastocatellia bacterium]|nr:hypothetical protein [Blastocatellia bacterium]